MDGSNITGPGNVSVPTLKNDTTTGVDSKTIATITASIIFVMLVSVVAGTVFRLCRNRRPEGDEEELQSSHDEDQTYTDSRDFYMASGLDRQVPSGSGRDLNLVKSTAHEPRATHGTQVLTLKGHTRSDTWRMDAERNSNSSHFVQLETSRIPDRNSAIVLQEQNTNCETDDSYMMHNRDVDFDQTESRDEQKVATTVFDRFSDDNEFRSPILFQRV